VSVLDKPNPGEARYFLVREDLLPEGIVKTIEAKRMLDSGEVATIHDAVEQVGLSRSAFYKYKEGVFSLSKLDRERIVTISINLEHRAGMLSKVLQLVATYTGNVLTIHQSIPLQGVANVVLSVETSGMGDQLAAFMGALRKLEGVSKAQIIGQD
jgi:chorismate mutase